MQSGDIEIFRMSRNLIQQFIQPVSSCVRLFGCCLQHPHDRRCFKTNQATKADKFIYGWDAGCHIEQATEPTMLNPR